MQIDEAREIMSRRGWLPATPESIRTAVLERCGLRSFVAGEAIYRHGDPPGGLWGLAAGRIAIEPPAASDFGAYIAYYAAPGYWIGAASIVTRTTRQVGISAARDCVLLHLSIADFEAIAVRDPSAWRWLAVLPIQQTLLATGVATDLMIRDPRRRLMAILLRLAGCRDSPGAGAAQPEEIVVSQEALAVLVNLSRTALGEMLRDFECNGLIARRYRIIRLNAEKGFAFLAADRRGD
jgi:CRP-like cAMP-binding protein